ncbi:MAG TPA: GreA/GreB family elongation factor [Verrucomicrobiae bacterium]|nr:GreA/GreB family elongation factor [Verrucomicrobiae bacterium]
MNKKALLKAIVSQLISELEVYLRAAQAAHAEATHEQSKAESKYDTRGLEASYLARGQSRQAAEMQAAIQEFESMEPKAFGKGELIDVGAIVELEQGKERTVYFIGPRAGGTEVTLDEREILVITPQSPLGSQLVGKKQGDRLQLTIAGTRNQYRVVAVS